MPISLHIEAANFEELMGMIGALTAPTPRATRGPNKPKDAPAADTGASGTALPSVGNGQLPEGMTVPQAGAANDMFDDPPPVKPAMTPTAATPPTMTQEQFLTAMRGLLGKGKDDAVRAKVAQLGYARVRDVPPEKMVEVYAAAQQV